MEKMYIRVSTKEQEIERQIVKANELGIAEENRYIDKQSGKDFNREQYQLMKENLQEGDLLYLDSLDRLGRNYDLIKEEWHIITKKIKADIIVLDNAELFDSRKFKAMGDIGKLLEDQMLSMLAYVAETERKKMLVRQKEGIAVAKAAGKYKGRPKKYTENNSTFMHAIDLYKEGKMTVKEIIQITKVSTFSVL